MNKENIITEDDITLAEEKNDVASAESYSVSNDKIVDSGEQTKENLTAVEVPELRDKNKKVFSLSDGTQQAVFYPHDIHFFDDETQSYQEIENVIVEENDGKHFSCKNPHFTAKFSREENNDELFKIEHGMQRVTVLAKKSHKQHKDIKPTLHKKPKHNINSDIVCFSNAEPNVDYEYSVDTNGVKEDIIVKEKASIYRYPFILKCENVTAEYDEGNKRISFLSHETGEEVFFIPAPFMKDANDKISYDVSYELKTLPNGDIQLTVIADSSWINSDECVLPVTIDPQIKLTNNGFLKTYVYTDGVIKEPASDTNALMFYCNNGKYEEQQPYLSITKPTLPKNPRIKKAELELTISSFLHSVLWNETDKTTLFGLYNVTGDVVLGGHNPACDVLPIDYAGICDTLKTESTMCFDVTDQIDQLVNGDKDIANLKLGFISDDYKDAYISFYNHKNSRYCPKLNITYESSYAINSSYRTHAHELGRFGQGSIDLQCGNLMFESTDFAWGGNRMPVTIKHLYNSALSGCQYNNNDSIKLKTGDFSSLKIGNGFKLNLMQSMKYTSFQDNGSTYYGYVFIDENGNETYFKHSSSETVKIDECCTETCSVYEDIETGDMLYHEGTHTLVIDDDKYQFDGSGRLISITDKYNNQLIITYTNNRISSVTDGAGRDFCFDYDSNGFLSAITAPNHTNESPVLVKYGYSGNNLSTITYEDGREVVIDYLNDKPSCVTLYDKDNNSVYKVEYIFTNDKLKTVTEYGVENGQLVLGTSTEYTYSAAAGRTHVKTTEPADDGESTDNVIDTVYVFDDDGELINEYFYSDDIGNVLAKGDEAGGINPHSGEDSAKYTKNTVNLLQNHDFTSLEYWAQSEDSSSFLTVEKVVDAKQAKYGNTFLKITSTSLSCIHKGVICTYNNLPAGKYTFSAYVRAVSEFVGEWSPGALIFVRDSDGNMLSYGECLKGKDDNYTRLIAPFELAESQTIKLELLVNGKGTAYFDAAQLEKNDFASEYNMLKNGSFQTGWSGWTASKIEVSTDESFDGDQSLILPGTLTKTRYADQYVSVSNDRDTRETFTLSGWAKGFALPMHEREGIEKTPEFNVTAIIQYYDTEKKELGNDKFVAELSTTTEEWQYFSITFAKSKHCKVSTLQIQCNYNYNMGNAYFDNLQLVRDSIEFGLSEDDFKTDTNSSDSEIITTGDTENRTLSEFEELIDEFGNTFTETIFNNNEIGTIYRAFEFTSGDDNEENAGNDLVAEIDARGNKTEYIVDDETSRNEEVIDRCGNITAYEYDASGKTTKVTSKNSNHDELANVSYAYDAFDNMKEIVRGDGLKYVLKYNAFHDLESIGIDGKTDGDLVKYTYKNGGGKLKQITYANGHTMKAKYNSIGQMISEIWSDTNNCIVAHYKYAYDGEGNIVRSIDICDGKEYNYIYEGNKLVRATEYNVVVVDEIVVSKNLSNNIFYTYKNDELFSKHIVAENGGEHTVFYEKSDDDNNLIKLKFGNTDVLIRSKNDSFGRKEFEEIQHQNGYLYRKFAYLNGEIPETHKDNLKVKSEATTQLVSNISFSDARTISYEYDEEERITKVIDSIEGVETVTDYTYDALGQLKTEAITKNEVTTVVNNMTYDNYGNILTKNGVAYTYGDPVWKDKLTKVGDQEIVYDEQGNPTKYLGYDLVWEKGRQLKWFDTNCYTYNANGIRTSKTVDFVRHDFVLEGSKILRETWEDNILISLYNTDDSICGIIYNDEPYYFQKNLQGDIVGITDCNSQVVAKYSYDAWGACTITEDTSCCGISTINPYRYRGYYYDDETGMYYLQSRYYDPIVGRFINSDDIESVLVPSNVLLNNSCCYCCNNPINEVDHTGNFIGAIIRKIVLGIVLGFFTQFCIDYIDWVYKKCFKNSKQGFRFSTVGEYVGTILSSIIEQFSSLKVVGLAFSIILICVKYIPKIVSGNMKQSDMTNLLVDVCSLVLSILLKSKLKKLKTKRKQIHKKMLTENTPNLLKLESKRINLKIKYFGMTIYLTLPIPQKLLNVLINILFA